MALHSSELRSAPQQSSGTNTQSVLDNSRPPGPTDEWAPPEDEIGTGLSQVLKRKRKALATPDVSQSPEIIGKEEVDGNDTAAATNKIDSGAMQTVLDMFDDRQENEVVEVKHNDAAVVDSSLPSDPNPSETKDSGDKNNHVSEEEEEEEDDDDDHGGVQSGTMTFMDEESARNYQRIVEEERRKQRRRQRRSWLEERRRSQNAPTPPKPTVVLSVSSGPTPKRLITVRPSSDVETIGSADELPVDPLDPFSPSSSSAKRRRVVSNRISDDEDSDDANALDKRAILKQRLRTKSTKQPSTSRYEQARINANYREYDTDTDANASIESGDRSQPNADSAPDMPDTDSESEKPKKDAVFVINDSSDDDFVSDPEEPLSRKPTDKSKSLSSLHAEKVSRFASSFERQRVKPSAQSTSRTSAKIVKGYSDELDDDMADFIVDDDDSDGLEEPENVLNGASTLGPRIGSRKLREAGEGLPAAFSLSDLSSSFTVYVQYLVYWFCSGRTEPAIDEDSAAYFFQAYSHIERTISSIEHSLAESSVWVESFRTSLFAYPSFHSSPIASIPGCDACRFHQNRTAATRITFTGEPYNRSSLRPPRPEHLHFDLDDNSLPDTEDLRADFNVGKTCFKRAKVCHELHHYFFHLMYAVEGNLRALEFEGKEDTSIVIDDSDGGDSAEPWDKTDPEKLMQMLETEGRIEKLYLDYKDMLSRSKDGFAS